MCFFQAASLTEASTPSTSALVPSSPLTRSGHSVRKSTKKEAPLSANTKKKITYVDIDMYFSKGKPVGGANFGGPLGLTSDVEKQKILSGIRHVGVGEPYTVYEGNNLSGYSEVPCTSDMFCKNLVKTMNVYNRHLYCACCLLRHVEYQNVHKPSECPICIKAIEDIYNYGVKIGRERVMKEEKGKDLRTELVCAQFGHFRRARDEWEAYLALGGDITKAPPSGFKLRKKVKKGLLKAMGDQKKQATFVTCMIETGPHVTAHERNYEEEYVEAMRRQLRFSYDPETVPTKVSYKATTFLKRKRSSCTDEGGKRVKSVDLVVSSDDENDVIESPSPTKMAKAAQPTSPAQKSVVLPAVTVWEAFEKSVLAGQKDVAKCLLACIEEGDVPPALALVWVRVRKLVRDGRVDDAQGLLKVCLHK